MELTLAAALIAGLVSFFSPCCLPVVPAYLGQLGVTAAAASTMAVGPGGIAASSPPRVLARGRVLFHALAFVLGFGAIFTLLGVTAYVAAGPLRDNLPLLRQVGGIVLIVLGLNLMGVLRLRLLSRSWRPFDRFGQAPVGGAAAKSPLAALALGSIFAIGWTPCIGPTLGAILTLSAISPGPEVVLLLVAYSIGLGVPFVALAFALDGAGRFTRPFVRHGRLIELVGGALVVLIGLAIYFDFLAFFAQRFSFLWPQI